VPPLQISQRAQHVVDVIWMFRLAHLVVGCLATVLGEVRVRGQAVVEAGVAGDLVGDFFSAMGASGAWRGWR